MIGRVLPKTIMMNKAYSYASIELLIENNPIEIAVDVNTFSKLHVYKVNKSHILKQQA